MLSRILYGNNTKDRKSRLHDQKGNFVGWQTCLSHGPRAVLTGALRLTIDYRPALPWISYKAISTLKTFLNKNSRVLEFGSGMSTVWYAAHAGEVCSVEDYRPWYDKVSIELEKRSLKNINYHFASSPEEYYSFMTDDPEGFDLVMVDGSTRGDCLKHAAKLLKPGGIIYLDNSDKCVKREDIRFAEEHALHIAEERSAAVTYFTDFAPTQLFVQQGLMVKMP